MTSETWFTSDLHFYHLNVNKYSDRPCNKEGLTKDEMNEWLINQLNSFIGKDDTVKHLGDFAFVKEGQVNKIVPILEQLNGNWEFILGNHDDEETLIKTCKIVNDKLGTNHKVLGWYAIEKHKGKKFIMNHFPFRFWQDSRHGSINVHGHEHGAGLKNGLELPNQIDVGIDAIEDFKPLRVQEVIDLVAERNPEGLHVDHHNGQKTGGN